MLKKFTNKQKNPQKAEAENMLRLELAEITDISANLFSRLETKIKELLSLEKRLDKKTEYLEELLRKAEAAGFAGEQVNSDRYHEIAELAEKGLKVDEIANILDIPRGEIELTLGLRK